MKKFALLITVLTGLLTSFDSSAQVHAGGMKGLEITVGRSKIGTIIGGGYTGFLNEKMYYKGSVYYETGRPYQLKYNNVGFDVLFQYTAFNIEDLIFLSASAGPTFSYETLKPTNGEGSVFNYGIKPGIEAEAYLNDQVAFLIKGNQTFLFKKSMGNQRFDISVGVRFIINN